MNRMAYIYSNHECLKSSDAIKQKQYYIYAAGAGQSTWSDIRGCLLPFPRQIFSYFKDNHKMPVSKQEQRLFDALKPVVKTRIHQSFRPDFLKNIKTGHNLEIDIYLPQLKIGFEYQGAVHFYKLTTYKNDPDKSRDHDTKKHEMLETTVKRRVAMVEIFEVDLEGDIVANVVKRCKNMIVYFYKKRHFAKCQSLQNLINKIEDNFNEEGKRRMRYYELLHKTQSDIPAKYKGPLFNSVDHFIKQNPFVTDLSYAGEKVDLPFAPQHIAIRAKPSNRSTDLKNFYGDKDKIEVKDVAVSVKENKDVTLSIKNVAFDLSYDEWREIKSFVKGRCKLIDDELISAIS